MRGRVALREFLHVMNEDRPAALGKYRRRGGFNREQLSGLGDREDRHGVSVCCELHFFTPFGYMKLLKTILSNMDVDCDSTGGLKSSAELPHRLQRAFG
jgi:hypothetical protein